MIADKNTFLSACKKHHSSDHTVMLFFPDSENRCQVLSVAFKSEGRNASSHIMLVWRSLLCFHYCMCSLRVCFLGCRATKVTGAGKRLEIHAMKDANLL